MSDIEAEKAKDLMDAGLDIFRTALTHDKVVTPADTLSAMAFAFCITAKVLAPGVSHNDLLRIIKTMMLAVEEMLTQNHGMQDAIADYQLRLQGLLPKK